MNLFYFFRFRITPNFTSISKNRSKEDKNISWWSSPVSDFSRGIIFVCTFIIVYIVSTHSVTKPSWYVYSPFSKEYMYLFLVQTILPATYNRTYKSDISFSFLSGNSFNWNVSTSHVPQYFKTCLMFHDMLIHKTSWYGSQLACLQ